MKEYPLNCPLPKEFRGQGIYAIKHTDSNRFYVGSSTNVRARIFSHINSLNKNTSRHHSLYLQNAWNKYGEENFIALILEKVADRNQLIDREQYWIDKLDSFHNGFNGRPIAEANYGMEWSDEQNELRKISNEKTWADPSLREKLSKRFKGRHRGEWSNESHKKISATLRKRHQEDPSWREKTTKILQLPENLEKRTKGIRESLKDKDILKKGFFNLRKHLNHQKESIT